MTPLILAALAIAATPAATRTVHVELRDGERILAQPVITLVPSNGPATMQVAGPQGYRLSVALEPAVAPAAYTLRLRYARPAGEGWSEVAAPVLRVGLRQPARIEIDDGRDPALSMTVRVD